jgi:hypothetical protein
MKHIAQLIEGTHSVLHQLWEKNQQVQQINQTLTDMLPSPLSKHCRVVNLREQTAVIYTDSAVWATRLRYLIPEVLLIWQQQAAEITKIEIRVHLEAIEPVVTPHSNSTSAMSPVSAPIISNASVERQPSPETTPFQPVVSSVKKRGPYPLTQNAADYLRHTADLTPHPHLKAVLLRLASRSQTDKD